MPDALPTDRIWSGAGPYRMTWSDYGVLTDRLTAQIAADGFRPDAICCVARGGLVTAAHLATVLDVERMHVVRVRRCAEAEPSEQRVPRQSLGTRINQN